MEFAPNQIKTKIVRYDELDNLDATIHLAAPIQTILETPENDPSYWFTFNAYFLRNHPDKKLFKNKLVFVQFTKKTFLKAWQECPAAQRDLDLTSTDNVIIKFSKHSVKKNSGKRYSKFCINEIRRSNENV